MECIHMGVFQRLARAAAGAGQSSARMSDVWLSSDFAAHPILDGRPGAAAPTVDAAGTGNYSMTQCQRCSRPQRCRAASDFALYCQSRHSKTSNGAVSWIPHLGLGAPLPGCIKGFMLCRGPSERLCVDSLPLRSWLRTLLPLRLKLLHSNVPKLTPCSGPYMQD